MRKEVFIDTKTGEIVKSIASYEIFENYNIFENGYEENYQNILNSRDVIKIRSAIENLDKRIIDDSFNMMKKYKALVTYLDNKDEPLFKMTNHKELRNDINKYEYSINLYKNKLNELLAAKFYEEEC